MNKNRFLKVLLPIFLLVLAVFFINKVSVGLIPDRTSYELPINVPFKFSIAPLLNMDGRHFLTIACRGYFVENGVDQRVFFPVYPILIKILSLNCFLNPIFIGLAINIISLVASLWLLAKLLDEKIRSKVVLLLLIFPTAFFFICFYTESVFFLLVVSFFWFLEKKKLLPAAIIAALASATRIVGISLAAVLLAEAVREYLKNRKVLWPVFISPLGLVGYSLYNYLTTGNFLTFLLTQKHWDRPVGLSAPIYAFVSQVKAVFAGPLPTYDSPFVYPVILLEFAVAVFILVVIILSYKKIKNIYWIYLTTSYLIILFGGIFSATPRYSLVLFPIQIYLAENLKGKSFILWCLVSAILFIFCCSLFLRGYWVS